MSRGENACFVCQRGYGHASGRFSIATPDGQEVYVDGSCREVIDDLARHEGISRWEAVTRLLARIETNLFGTTKLFGGM